MRLTKLEIFGFKSFAKRTEIIFPQNVTGIVGPNGSGKSNIGDAVRWVLGEQSARNLRGNSMQDVIFNGTEQRRPMNMCEVTLVFDNTDGKLPISFEEVSITRRVYRSGDSEYLMNGSGCRLKDIVDLFRDTGVGKEGYSLIGQGRIDEILSQRSEDRRVVFEEAAGISRFRSRKEEAENRLKKAEENLTRVQDVLDELDKHLGPLKEQADIAKEYLSLADSLKELDLRLYLIRYDRLDQKEAIAQQTLLQLADAVNASEKTLEEAAAVRDRLEAEQESLQTSLASAHDSLLQQNENLYQARESMNEVQNRLNNGEETIRRLESEKEAILNKLKLIEATLRQSDGGLNEAEVYLSQANENLEACRKQEEEAVSRTEVLEAELAQHNALVMERMNRIQSGRTAQARRIAMQQAMTQRCDEISLQLSAEEEKGLELERLANEAAESLLAEEEKLKELQEQLSVFEKSTEDLLRDILAKQKQIHEEQQNIRAKETRLHTLKELQDGYEGYQYSVKNALTHAGKSNMKGVHGVLGMLLEVPREYETALDMALGAGVQNIVTETEQEAKALIDYLRTNHLGRATFLPMSTVKSRVLSSQEREVLAMEGCVGIASELIGFSEPYRGIVENLLGRTVIAKDLDSGIAIMRKGGHAFRLVTLQGDVMHQGGSMTGGSAQQKAQNLLGRDREIKELAASVQQMTETVDRLGNELAQAETTCSKEKEKKEKTLYDLHQQEIAVARDTEHLASAKGSLATNEESKGRLKEAISQLEESLEEIRQQIAEAEASAKEEELGGEDLNARTEELSKALDQARHEREAVRERLTDAMLVLQNAQHDTDVLRRDRRRLSADSENCKKDLGSISQKQELTRAQIQSSREQQGEAQRRIEENERAAASAKEYVGVEEEKLKAKQEEIRSLQNEMESQRREAQHETERMHRQEMAVNRIHTDLAALNDRIWTTYELTHAGAEEALGAYTGQVNMTGDWRESFDEKQGDENAAAIRDRIRAMGTVNVASIDEYAQLSERFTQLSAQKTDLEHARTDLEQLISELLNRMKTVFIQQFELLQQYFAETFIRLFGGGCGEIRLADPEDPLGCGIDIIVQPPGKKRQLLSLFSGGERALTAIAILFAMLKLKPTPFCILDEIEAALDDANISSFADYLKEFSSDTQFVVVTHRKGTMERCDNLFGVAMEEKGISSMVSVNLTDYQ